MNLFLLSNRLRDTFVISLKIMEISHSSISPNPCPKITELKLCRIRVHEKQCKGNIMGRQGITMLLLLFFFEKSNE